MVLGGCMVGQGGKEGEKKSDERGRANAEKRQEQDLIRLDCWVADRD